MFSSRSRSRSRSRALVLAASLLACGCARAETPAPATMGAATIGADAADALAVDDFGDTIVIGVPAQRVVSLNPVTTELIFALGAGDRLVGRTHWDLHPEAARLVTDVGDGMTPNVEMVLGQHPDLVILYATESNRSAVARFTRAGVRTLTFRTDHVSDLARVAAVIAAALGVPGSGKAVADSVTASIAAVAALPAPPERLRVYWHVWESPLLTIGKGSFLSELLLAAGADNIFDDLAAPSPQVSLEEIARRDPDVILAGPTNAAKLRAHPGWAALRAVREGRLLVLDTVLVGRPGVRMGEAAWYLRGVLYPQAAR